MTVQENNKFISEVIEHDLLDKAIQYIERNVSIDEIYQDKDIVEWVKNNKNVNEVFEEYVVIEHCKDSFEPEVVFDKSVLESWALNNGFIKE